MTTSHGLPGLFPVHDGSYGVNTLVNVEPLVRRGGRTRASGVADEDDEDRIFRRRVHGRDGRRFDMNQNGDSEIQSAVDAANQDHADPTNGAANGGQPEPPITQETGTNPPVDTPNIHPHYKSDKPDSQQIKPAIPSFGWAGFIKSPPGANPRTPPYTQTELPTTLNEYSYINNSHLPESGIPRSPPPYGVPTGRGSYMLNSTSSRPDTSRSFLAESGIYGNASLNTPPDTGNQEMRLTRDEQLKFQFTGRLPVQRPLGTKKAPSNQFAHLPPPRFLDPNVEHGKDGADVPGRTPEIRRSTRKTRNPHTGSTDSGVIEPIKDKATQPNAKPNTTKPTTTSRTAAEKATGILPTNPTRNPPQQPDLGIGAANPQPPATHFASLGTEKDGRQPNEESRTKELARAQKATGLTPSQLRHVTDFIRDMRAPQRPTRSASQPPILPLDKLSLPEIKATKKMISSMGGNPARVETLMAELDNAEEILRWKTATSNTNATKTNANATENTADPPVHTPVPPRRTTLPIPRPRVTRRRWYSSIGAFIPQWRRKLPHWAFFILFSIFFLIAWFCIAQLALLAVPAELKSRLRYSELKEAVLGQFERAGSVSTKLPINPNVIDSLRKKLPDAVHVNKDKDGEPVISQDFWHALKELIKADDVILNLVNTERQPPEISEDHWQAIRARLGSSGLQTQDVGQMIDKSLARSWDIWLERNQADLRKNLTGSAISKDEFVKLIHRETQTYQSQIRREFEGMDKRVAGITDELNKLRNRSAALDPSIKDEINSLVKAATKKLIDHAVLDAIANGQIRGHADDILANHVNHFGVGAGAVVDPTLTSLMWKPPHKYPGTKEYKDRDGYKPQPPITALLEGAEEGQCFCGGPNRDGSGAGTNTLSVLTSRIIIPQHLVVQHMLPGATLDPGAMPKDIEVWAYIEEVTVRDTVALFSQEQFPEKTANTGAGLNEGFVKIGQFVYEHRDWGNGKQIFKMSDQLVSMGARTEHIVVRATSNYGAKDHTCFYRVKMYGEIIERERDMNHPWERFEAGMGGWLGLNWFGKGQIQTEALENEEDN